MKTSKLIIIINVIILILCIPGFIILNNYLSKDNSGIKEPDVHFCQAKMPMITINLPPQEEEIDESEVEEEEEMKLS